MNDSEFNAFINRDEEKRLWSGNYNNASRDEFVAKRAWDFQQKKIEHLKLRLKNQKASTINKQMIGANLLTSKQLKDEGYEVWKLNDIEWWVGFDKYEIIKKTVDQTGVPQEELLDDPQKVIYWKWDELIITEQEEPFHPRYTFTNYIQKLCHEGQEFPCLIASTEW